MQCYIGRLKIVLIVPLATRDMMITLQFQ